MKLKLDEKKIRKGKPVGLPYIGSKKKISKKIVELIKQNFGMDKTIYDVFGGGGAITAECLIQGLNVVYNDINKDITDMFVRVLSKNRDWLKSLIISREEFHQIKSKQNKTIDEKLKLLINSFGNNGKDYLYSVQNSKIKYELAREIIAKHDCFSNYKQTDTFKIALKLRSQQLERLEQLQRLQQLERLQQLQQLKIYNLDYKDFSNVKNAIFYLDPPYENTDVKYYEYKINYKEFYNWCVELAKNNIVLISSYEICDERFEVVYEFTKARSTLQSGSRGKHEKLFMVKDIYIEHN